VIASVGQTVESKLAVVTCNCERGVHSVDLDFGKRKSNPVLVPSTSIIQMPEKGILKGVDGDVSVSVSRDSQKPVKISVSGEDGGDLGSGHSSEIDFFDEYHVPYELPPYIHRPCPCGLQVAMYVMGGGEVVSSKSLSH